MKKTNKTFKRFAAITSASLLAACAVAPVAFNAFATSVSINPNGSAATQDTPAYDKDVTASNHVYKAYPIFTGDYDTEKGLTVTGWGEGYDSSGLLSDTTFTGIVLTAAETDPDDPSVEITPAVTVGSFIGSKTDAATVAQAIEQISEDEYDDLAEILAKHTGTNTGTSLGTTAVDLSEGYYVIKDTYTVGTDTATNDALSKFILKVAGDDPIVINPKKSYPTVEKKVKENQSDNYAESLATYEGSDKSWNDVADYTIGDTISFKLYGTLPSTLDDYTNGYKYVFHDKIDSKFDLIDSNNDRKVDVIVSIDGNTITSGYVVENTTDGFTVTFENIKNITQAKAGSIVTVEYKATLNSNAVIGQNGQTNEVYLEYSNNPEWFDDSNDNTIDNTTDKTAVDKVVVFTYELDVTKVDGATGVTLANAEFNLSRDREVNNGGVVSTITEYVQINNEGKVTGWTTTAPTTGVLKSDANGLFKVIGLDEGTYKLYETKAPTAEYNLLTEPIIVEINATTSNTQGEDADGTELTALTLTSDNDDDVITYNATAADKYGIAKIDVANNKGTQLPGTGGIGTTIFYLGGGAMAAIGGIYLISKRRMRKSEE